MSADAEVNMVKKVVLQTDMPTVVSREPTNVREVQQIKGKTPLSTVPPKPPKQKIVKFARGTKGNRPQEVWGSETRENCEPQPLMQGCQVLLGCCQLRLERCQLQIPVCQLMCQLAAWSQSKPPQLLRKAPLQLQAPRCLLIEMLQCQTQKEVILLPNCHPQEPAHSSQARLHHQELTFSNH